MTKAGSKKAYLSQCAKDKWYIEVKTKDNKTVKKVALELFGNYGGSFKPVSPVFKSKFEAVVWAKTNGYEIIN